ncbi:hypothetical protein OTU49_015169 [Cherax quadricarinatus]|uniref:Uncharacterized protein n=1 Tax=Cherax quadricarinatus TaxID=27406 RepID=A0AAW0XZZ4_CHEQU|nr:uncharacterized protein LOC128685307 isoform X1 [Cherax quadricarinatus]
MKLLTVLCVVLAVSVSTWAQPQRPRQTPLAMGMRLLDNLRSGMTRTFQGIFGGGPRREKETPSERPRKPQQVNVLPPAQENLPPAQQNFLPPAQQNFLPPAQQNFLPPAQQNFLPPAQQNFLPPPIEKPNAAATATPSSFFKVFQDTEVSTAFPDIQGFTDESLKPNAFLSGTTPFQGTVDEDQLPFIPKPLVQNQLSLQDSFSTHSQFKNDFRDFGSPKPGDTITETSLPFGNTVSFSLGSAFETSRTQDSFHQESQSFHFPSAQESKDSVSPAREHTNPQSLTRFNQPSQNPDGHNNHQVLSRSIESSGLPTFSLTVPQRESVSHLHPTVIIRSQSPSPTHMPTQHFTEQHKRRYSTKDSLATPSIRPATHELEKPSRDQQHPRKKPLVPVKTSNGHINAGTKMRVTPKQNEDGTEGAEVSSYEFGYGVLDSHTGNQFFHAEKREEGQTRGSYKIQLPDGRVQTVTYVANSHGFHPEVTFDGEARFPDTTPTPPA